MLRKICFAILPTLRLPFLRYGRTIVSLSHEEKRETTSNAMFLMTCLQWSGTHRAAQTPVGVDMDFHNPNLKRLAPKPWL
jgi:hypothetical protein